MQKQSETLRLKNLPPQWREFYRLSREMAAEVKRIRQQDKENVPARANRTNGTKCETGST